jgi:hypothetical protein
VEVVPAPKKQISKIQHLDIEQQIELMGEEIGTTKQNVDLKSLVFM